MLALIIVMLCTIGFGHTQQLKAKVEAPKEPSRFKVIYNYENDDSYFQILEDSQTGKKFFYYQHYQSAAMVEMKWKYYLRYLNTLFM